MPERKKKYRLRRTLLVVSTLIVLMVFGFVTWFVIDTRIEPPREDLSLVGDLQRVKTGPDAYRVGDSWLRKNEFGLWEMYLEGEPFEMGVINGKLTKELIYAQESAFVEKIREMIPSDGYLRFLKYFIRFFNRDIDEYILPEYKEEIYGISFSASDEFEFIGSNYHRMLNYHGAHDIGHALQDLMLVGCTSFAANMGSADSSMILGRNFDFYISDAFAKDKIVCFVNPSKGHRFAYVTWASFIGVVSGMNDQGLTVTINAGESDIPFSAATPISLLAREILQYAGNLEEAISIAGKRKIFVSESLLIGSAADNRAIIIEKSPSKMGVYETGNEWLVCANHFQSEVFDNNDQDERVIPGSVSAYRQERAEELLGKNDTITFLRAAEILRDRRGLHGRLIGMGNEKAMAQMISHHSVIMEPLRRWLWVSTAPYQFGPYLAYNLDTIFKHPFMPSGEGRYDTSLTIPADPFIYTEDFSKFVTYRRMKEKIRTATEEKKALPESEIEAFVGLNPEYYEGYVLAGDYFGAMGNGDLSKYYYRKAMEKEFEDPGRKVSVEEKINELP
jgi:isopenicillin-N N-acyltransferase-like protein